MTVRSKETRRTANLLAAAGLLMADEQLRAIEQTTGLQASSAAALITIGHAPGGTIDFLRRVLGRSHSAVVRLVGSLAEAGLVEKSGSDDGRVVSLTLTAAGESVARQALEVRGRAVARRLSGLGERDRRALVRGLEALLAQAVNGELDAYQVCRLCDGDACDPCPVEAAAVGATSGERSSPKANGVRP